MLKIYDFSIDNVKNPVYAKVKNHRFGWKIDSDKKDILQKAYRIVISKDGQPLADTGSVESRECCDIVIDSPQLQAMTEYDISLTVWDNKGEESSYTHKFFTEILPEQWQAQWIKPQKHISGWAPYMRTKFLVEGQVSKATLYACGLGCGEYYINGERTDDYYVDPPASNYEKTIYYRIFDVTSMISTGGNALAVLLGEGFYAQSRVWGFAGMQYGPVCAIMKLVIEKTDGTVQIISTNKEDWKYKYSPISVNNIYGGETYDCRLETPDFALYDSEEYGWEAVTEDETPKGELTLSLMPPVKVVRTLPAVTHWEISGKSDGAWIYDIGENIAGIAEFKLPYSPRGAVYVFRFAETINAGGSLDYRSIGTSATQTLQQQIYICRGDPQGEIYRARFCYHGFRYVEVTGVHDFSQGYGTMPQLSIVTGVQLSTNMAKTVKFSTSYEYLDRLYKIMDNTFISNYHGFPEDCPAREKCGWLGDAEVVGNWGLLNYDSASSYRKYLNDIRTTKEVYGTWLMIAPGKRGCGNASPLWGCAQILLPYFMYKYWGDRHAVLENMDLMEAWVEHETARANDYIITEGLGDWDPAGGNRNPRRMPVKHSSTLMFYEINMIMAELCRELSIGDESKYLSLAAKIKESFNRNFYNSETHSYGYWGSDGVALKINIYPEGEKEALLASLVATIQKEDYEMPTGIYGNKYLAPVLVEEGFGDVALEYLFNLRHPSFGTMIEDNGTTVWEIPSMKHIEDRETIVSSYDHPMHGGFLYFTLTHFAGIQPGLPGFARIEYRPCFTSATENVRAEFDSPYGLIVSEIRKIPEGHKCSLTIPAGADCKVALDEFTVNGAPGVKGQILGSGQYEIIVGC